MKTNGTRLRRVREVVGAIGDIAAVAVLVSTTCLAAVLTVGTAHFFYGIW